jgi:Caspase domain
MLSKIFAFVVLGVILSASCAYAARIALVVGNDAYTHVTQLKNAGNDAKLMAQTLRDAKFDVTYVANVDRINLWRAIETLGKKIQSGDEVVFFFAGHGVQIEGDAVLLPVDIKPESDKQVLREGLRLLDVQDELKNAKISLLVIDACRDNPFPKQGTRSIGGNRGLVAPEVKGQAIIMAAGRNQKALDYVPGGSASNGLFTYEFVQIIKAGVDIRSALAQVRDKVDDQARRANHEQRPSFIDDLRGNFFFFAPIALTVQPAVASSVMRMQAADEIEQQAWEATKQLNSLAGYQTYIKEYPSGRYLALARINIAGLQPAASNAQIPVKTYSLPTVGSMTEYRRRAAQLILAANNDVTFSGRLPDPLYAIPVVKLELNADGSIRNLTLERRSSFGLEANQMSIDAVRRVGNFGRIDNLPTPWVFSEVFLFNEDRKFQLKTAVEGL